MKALIGLFIASMFGLELMSPFMIGYLNDKDQNRKKHSTTASSSNRKIKKSANSFEHGNKPANSGANETKVCAVECVDFSADLETAYSDSKSLKVRDDNSAFVQ
jgi:hypothetical protein